MTHTERENFYRNSTLIVDHTNESFTGLLHHDLTKQGLSLLQFIQAKQHEIYHLCYNIKPCCMCPPGSRAPVFRHNNRILNPAQLDILLDTTAKIPGHHSNSQTKHCCCPANPNITYNQLDLTLTRCLLLNFTTVIPDGSPERLAVDELIRFRNESYGHATEGKISDHDYQINKAQIEKSIMVLAQAQGRESEFKQKLSDAAVRPLDETILRQYQTKLMENIEMMQTLKNIESAVGVKSLPDCLTKDLRDVTVTEGCDAHFEIRTREYGLCSLWLRDEVEIERSQKFIPGESGKIHVLDIRNTSLSDKGQYTVRIKDIERHAHLDVEEYFTKNLQSVECVEGDTAEFTCEVKEDSLPACWNKNGIGLKDDGKYEILQARKIHILSIKNCELHDTAKYAVSINNRVRETSLVVIEYFTKPLGTMTCMEGETVQFECEVLDNQTALWFKDGSEVSPSDKYKVETHERLHRLVVLNTRLADMGEYSVKIKNCVRHSQLIVLEYFTKPLGIMTCMEGETVQFECEVLDNQTALWFKDGSEASPSDKYKVETHERLHRLVVINTRLADMGEYSVKIKNCVRHSQLIVQEYFTKNLQSVECVEGDTAEFTCEVKEDSLPACWNKNGIGLKDDGKYEILQAEKIHRLSIKNCELHDTAKYAVSINNRVRETFLVVIEYFTKPLGTMTCMEGETVQFECEVLDNQTALWFKDGSEVSPSDKYKVETHERLHRLVVINTRLADMGEYSVKIKNCVRHSQLIVLEYFTKPLGIMTCMEGETVQFECEVLDNQTALWFKDGSEVSPSDKYKVETHERLHRFVVINTRLADMGEYSVKIKNCVRHSQLIVQEYFTKNMRSTYENIEGDIVELSCAVLEDNVTAYWEKDGVGVQHGDRYTITDEGKTHKLAIQHINLQDAGDYCVKIFDRMRSTSLTVKEYFTKPLGTLTCMEGETVQFECEVLDDQTAHWFKDGSKVSTSDRYKLETHERLHRLVVINTRLADMGEYSVKIKNCVRHSQLIVQEMPTAIKHLSNEDKELYINIIKTGTEIRNYIRIVILGENGVGKTCLLRRLLKQSIAGVQSTDGIDMHRCKIKIKDGQWVFDEVSDKKKSLLARIKTASQPITVEDETLQQKDDSLKASGLQDDDGSQNINREAVGTSLNISVRKRKTRQDKLEDGSVNRRKRKDQSFTTIHNASQDVEVDSQSPLKHNNTITKLLTDKVIQGLDDFLDGIEKVDVPADKFVECGILDFAGEKEYYATHPVFLNPNALHILVTNIMKDVKPITTEVGFDKIGEYIDFWLDTIHSCGVIEEIKEEIKTEFLYPPAVIVCTRIDECGEHLMERKNEVRKQLLSVLKNEPKKKHLREICFVSNTESAEEDFNILRDTIFKYGKQLKTFAEKLPLKWIHLEQSLEVLREAGLNILSWPDIVKLSSKCLIDSEDEIKLFLKYQHKVGGVVYFESLKEYIILNQKWLANAFRCLVSDKFDSNLKLTDEWKALEDTGKLEYSLIVKLFDKEPELDFNKHCGHLLNVMEIFGIIVKLSTLVENGQMKILPTYYLPCMISEKASVTDIVDRFNANKDNCKRTPWLCIEFDFMPFDFFNHILCYYINKHAMCTEPQTGRMAIYHGMGVFLLDKTKSVKFILCFCKNTIALQIWQWKNVEKRRCKTMLEELVGAIEKVKERFETRRVSYTVKSKCSDGNIHMPAGRHSCSELLDSGDDYFCEEHSDHHKTQDFYQTWFEDNTEFQILEGLGFKTVLDIPQLPLMLLNVEGMVVNIGASWCEPFQAWLQKYTMAEFKKKLSYTITVDRKIYPVYPPADQVFSWTWYCNPYDVKVVIVGQDPYHGPGQARGLAFSVPYGVPVPPSLEIIFAALCKDIPHGNLEYWAKQGVLLLNSILTVREGIAMSQAGIGWEEFTDVVISWLSNNLNNVVFMLWGQTVAGKKVALIDQTKHKILYGYHPSPLSAPKGYDDRQLFLHCNEYLVSAGKTPVIWTKP